MINCSTLKALSSKFLHRVNLQPVMEANILAAWILVFQWESLGFLMPLESTMIHREEQALVSSMGSVFDQWCWCSSLVSSIWSWPMANVILLFLLRKGEIWGSASSQFYLLEVMKQGPALTNKMMILRNFIMNAVQITTQCGAGWMKLLVIQRSNAFKSLCTGGRDQLKWQNHAKSLKIS